MSVTDSVRARLAGRWIAPKRWLHRRFIARSTMRPLQLLWGTRQLQRAFGRPGAAGPVAQRLAKGWGNPRYAATPELIATVIREVASADGATVECGSGVTSVVLAAARKHLDAEVVTLEHDDQWADKVRRRLRALRLDPATILHRPLRARGDCDWYEAVPRDLPVDIGLVVCDGPPAETRGGRAGVLELLDRPKPPRTVVIDDTDRSAEAALVDRVIGLGYALDVANRDVAGTHTVLRWTGNESAPEPPRTPRTARADQ